MSTKFFSYGAVVIFWSAVVPPVVDALVPTGPAVTVALTTAVDSAVDAAVVGAGASVTGAGVVLPGARYLHCPSKTSQKSTEQPSPRSHTTGVSTHEPDEMSHCEVKHGRVD